ncbi:MAG: hypothetical protein QJR07_07940 [Acetobacteraceae bacterium]|nr:hypothetical protein [Acetobacteraceae bacterium]
MASKVGDYVTNNAILVLVVLGVVAIAAFFAGLDTVTAFAVMLFGGVLMWIGGHHAAPEEPDLEDTV